MCKNSRMNIFFYSAFGKLINNLFNATKGVWIICFITV